MKTVDQFVTQNWPTFTTLVNYVCLFVFVKRILDSILETHKAFFVLESLDSNQESSAGLLISPLPGWSACSLLHLCQWRGTMTCVIQVQAQTRGGGMSQSKKLQCFQGPAPAFHIHTMTGVNGRRTCKPHLKRSTVVNKCIVLLDLQLLVLRYWLPNVVISSQSLLSQTVSAFFSYATIFLIHLLRAK